MVEKNPVSLNKVIPYSIWQLHRK